MPTTELALNVRKNTAELGLRYKFLTLLIHGEMEDYFYTIINFMLICL